MRKMIVFFSVLFLGLMAGLHPVSAQTILIDFEEPLPLVDCRPYMWGRFPEILASGTGAPTIIDFADSFEFISGQACQLSPGDSVNVIANELFSAVTVSLFAVEVVVYDVAGGILDSDFVLSGTYSYTGEFKTITFSANSFGLSFSIFDNLRLSFGLVAPPRVNETDVAAPVALFCSDGGGIDIYTVADSAGTFLTRALPEDILRAKLQAERSGTHTAIYNDGNVSLWILNTGEMQVNAGDYVSIFSYEAICGPLPDIPVTLLTPTPTPRDEFIIINRPR